MIILPFLSPAATLGNAGGKGASLARLTRLGLQVPPGFIIMTDAYRTFVAANNLSGVITASIMDAASDDAAQLERVSAKIRAAFSAGIVPGKLCRRYQTPILPLVSKPAMVGHV